MLELKINSVKNTSIDQIFVSSDDDKMLFLAKKLGANTIKRDEYYASDHVPMSDVYVHMAEQLDCDHIAYLNVTSPMLSDKTLQRCILKYESLPQQYDSLATVSLIREYMWMNGKAINYDPLNHPRSQDLPEIFGINFAACILPRKTMIENRNVVGNNFYKYQTPPEESIDIDTMLDFEIAEFLYTKSMQGKNV